MPLQRGSVQKIVQVGQREVDVAAALLLLQHCILPGWALLSLPPETVWLPFSAVGLQCCLPHHLVTEALLSGEASLGADSSLGRGVGSWLGCLWLGGMR